MSGELIITVKGVLYSYNRISGFVNKGLKLFILNQEGAYLVWP
jgi:hypothetical protein